ncbi:Hypothetical protein A7982_10357 [Minicystis rosea]|nr:Hypothetical protein A7982_10357 [Minicystis rosea]
MSTRTLRLRSFSAGAFAIVASCIVSSIASCIAGGEPKHETPIDGPAQGTPLIALGQRLASEGACDGPTAATPPIRRISRIEYDNAVRDLFGITNHPAAGFVPEEKTGVTIGFNTNIRSTVSALAVEQYLAAAESIADIVAANVAAVSGCTGAGDAACIKAFLTGRARRAFRGTLPDSEKDALLADYDAAVAALGAESALRFGIASVLLSPRFLYAVELGAGTEDVVALSGSEIAGRLAASLWRSVPDDALLAAADEGELDSAEGVMQAARAMLDDDRAESMLADFARQWLDVEQTPSLTRDNMVWPDFTADFAASLLTETEQLFTAVAKSDEGSFAELLTADYTMANAEIAQIYGASAPAGSGFEKVSLPPERRGMLTHASVLATHAHFNRESIVLRGKLVRFQLLCDPVSPPPPSVDTSLPSLDGGTSERDVAAQHASLEACRPCHEQMDPIGYGFGAFDAVGRYTPDNGEDISGSIAAPHLASKDDVSGAFDGPIELSAKLAKSEHAQQCYLIQSLRYALGRNEARADACSAAAAWEQSAPHGLRLKEVIVAITGSDTFRYRTRVKPGESCQ